MFHHFHDNDVHKPSQGSISKSQFIKIIKYIGRENILDADVFYKKLLDNNLKKHEVCFTFDDALKSQYDIALPILEKFKIKSFFFVYTSVFDDKPDHLEIYRFFRNNFYKNIDFFYDHFFINVEYDLKQFFKKKEVKISKTKAKFPFYSIKDIKFRLVRDELLKMKEYDLIMNILMKEKKFRAKEYYKILFLNKKNLIRLNSLGHTIGLHSHSHPTVFEKLPQNIQRNEYIMNLKSISKILGKSSKYIKSMSHPCGSYNKKTLDILTKLKIKVGFRQVMGNRQKENNKKFSSLEIPREDHSNILSRLKLTK